MIRNCKLGKNVIFENKRTVILENCIIGDNCYIAAYSKIINANIGNDCKIYSFTNLYGTNLVIGNHCKIGTFVEITGDVFIGNNCVISSHSFICAGVTLEGNNFIGHLVSFSNDKNPQCYNKNFKMERTIIKNGAVIGTGSSVLPVTIGINAMVGLGSLVANNIPDNGLVYGKTTKANLIKIKDNE